MEVHHHPNVEKKNFKEYFLEFIMIFLAVTLGFFAESLRENISDHEREEQFIRSLANDVKADVDRLTYIIDARNKKEVRMDSLTCY